MPAPIWPALDGTEGALETFEIYAFPADWPRHWVVRRTFGLPSGEVALDVVPQLATHLESARELVPQGLYCQPRSELDRDPHLIEVWF